MFIICSHLTKTEDLNVWFVYNDSIFAKVKHQSDKSNWSTVFPRWNAVKHLYFMNNLVLNVAKQFIYSSLFVPEKEYMFFVQKPRKNVNKLVITCVRRYKKMPWICLLYSWAT